MTGHNEDLRLGYATPPKLEIARVSARAAPGPGYCAHVPPSRNVNQAVTTVRAPRMPKYSIAAKPATATAWNTVKA